MTMTLRIVGLDKVQRMLGVRFEPAMQAATLAIAQEIQTTVKPYPPATIANSPSNPTGQWYERGYGPKWRVKDGAVHGRRSSQTLGRRWGIKRSGAIGHVLGNLATYSGYLHAKKTQARWAGQRGWITDEDAVQTVHRSGAIQRIMGQAIVGAMREA